MRVIATKTFTASFASQTEQQQFITEFKAWKAASDPCSFLRFGKDVSTTVSIGNDFDKLWHVHLAPSNDDEDFERWEQLFLSKSHNARCKRSSNLLLFYASWKGNFILLAIDGHGIMQPPLDELNALCEAANRGVQWLKKS